MTSDKLVEKTRGLRNDPDLEALVATNKQKSLKISAQFFRKEAENSASRFSLPKN
jgi:hypothetical protein